MLSIPILYTMTSFIVCAQTVVWLPVFGFFNVRTDVNVWDCTWGMYGHCKRVCIEVNSGKKIHMSIVPGFLEQLLTELTLPLE